MKLIDTLTNKELKILKDTNLTAPQIAKKINKTISQVNYLRRSLGLKFTRGVKKGTIKNSFTKKCKTCSNEIKVTPCNAHTRFYCSRKCMYECPEYLKKLKQTDKSYMQTDEYKDTLRKEDIKPYKKYAGAVHRLSQKVYEEHIDKINPNRYPRTICGVKDGYQLDHIIPVRFGFDNGISIEDMCDVSNLRMIPWKENLKRNRKK